MIAWSALLNLALAAEPAAVRSAGTDVFALAQEVSRDPAQVDVAVAIYGKSLGKKGLEEAAAGPLFTLLVTQPARPAWIPTYEALLARRLLSDPVAVEIKLAEALSLVPARRAEGVKRLGALAAANPTNMELRRILGEALLRSGKASEALPWFRGPSGTQAFPEQAAAALIALGKVSEAVAIAPARVPAGCATRHDAVSCGQALAVMGYPDLAAAALKTGLARSLRSREDRTAAYVELARIALVQDGPGGSVWAWKEANKLSPADNNIRLATIHAMVNSGQASAARALVKPEEPIAATVQAVTIVGRVDPSGKKGDPLADLRLARNLDANHPAVVQAWAHYLIEHGEPAAALDLLNPHIGAHAGERSWVGYYTWAAARAHKGDDAVAVLHKALAAAETPADWSALASDLSRFEAIAGEDAKAAKRYGDAVAHYEAALALNPDTIELLRGLGGARWAAGELPAARIAYERARSLSPRDGAIVYDLAQLMAAQGNTEEARALLAAHGLPDARIQALDAELALSLETRAARELVAAGQTDEALARFRSLLERYPNNPLVLHDLADTYAALDQPAEALAHYRLARRADPDDIWLMLGEVNALIALNRPDEAHALLNQLPDVEDARAAKVKSEAGRAIARAEAAALVQAGHAEQAIDIYERLLRDHADTFTLSAVAAAYLSRWQYDAAEGFFREALRLDPTSEEAGRGLVETLLAQGRIEAARDEASALVKRNPNAANLQIAARVERSEAITRAAQALAEGRGEAARFILGDQLEANPGDPDLEVAMGALYLREGNAEAAWGSAKTVLDRLPTHSGALSLAQNAAVDAGHTKEVIALYKTAVAAGAPDWVEAELPHLLLADRLQRARDLYARGQPEAAEAVVDEAQRHYGNNQPRTWVIIGATWLAIERPERALTALETGRSLDPGDPGMALALAATYERMSRPGDAVAVLQASWEQSHNVDVGARLASLEYDRGNTMMAQRTAAEVQALAAEGGPPAREQPDPLRVLAKPSDGERPSGAQGRRAGGDPALPQSDVAAVDRKVNQGLSFTGEVGAGGIMRPGKSGEQFYNGYFFPVGAEVGIGGPFRLQGQVVPVRLTDGAHDEAGTAVDIGLTTSFTGNSFVSARVGSSPLGFTAGSYTTFYGVFGATFHEVGLEVDGGRAPVTDSVTSWAGVTTETGQIIGQARDSYLGVKIGGRMEAYGLDLSLLGRSGTTTAPAITPIPWKQVLGEARFTLKEEPGRATFVDIKGVYLNHEGQVDGFYLGAAGMFSPDLYLGGRARFEGLWYNEHRWAACAAGGAGPDLVQGEQTLFLYPGVYVGYELEGGADMSIAKSWSLGGHVLHQGTIGAYGQTAGFALLRYGTQPDSGLSTPSPTFTSLTHGPGLSHPRSCGAPLPR